MSSTAEYPSSLAGFDAPQAWGALNDTFSVDPLTGSTRFDIPLRLTAGRMGFGPELTLRYNSSNGASPFGLGWSLDVASIGRRSVTEVPRYREADDDTFELNDEELVPALRVSGGWIDDRSSVGEYLVQRYRRRYENNHDRIERWIHQPSGQTYWRVTDQNNITSLFGADDESRTSDPWDSTRISRWLLTERYDDRGNIIRYTYKREDLEGVDLSASNESHRLNKDGAQGAFRYLKTIKYGNREPHDRVHWHFEVVLDYGDESGVPDAAWHVRPDPYSSFRRGFEERVWRRCERVLMFHNFSELGDGPTLVSATTLAYDESSGTSLLSEVGYTGYITSQNSQRSLPSITLRYQSHEYDDTVRTLDVESIVNALINEKAKARWTDLHEEGLPGVLSRLGESWFYIRNLGAGRFAAPEIVGDSSMFGDEDEEVIDLTDSAMTAEPSHAAEYQPLTSMRVTANPNQDDQYVGYIDLNGDDADDVIVADDRVIRWYPSQGEDTFGDPIVLYLDDAPQQKPHRLYTTKTDSFFVADMTGDGMHDLVRIRSGEVSYWPNWGRGRFGNHIIITGSPNFDIGDDAGQILLVDVTGSGTSDLVWIGQNELRYWENYNGNRFGDAHVSEAPGLSPRATGLAAVDLLGQGTGCIVWLDQSEGPAAFRYVAPYTQQSKNLLVGVSNDRGLEVRVSYASSTQYWLRDRAAGGSWLSAMPVPIAVVDRMETRDRVAGTRAMKRFAYHHGHFDEIERRFAGFASTDRWESGSANDYGHHGLFPDEPVPPTDASRRPVPLLVKTWMHTGTQFEDSDLTVALKEEFFSDPGLSRRRWLSAHQMPLGQQARDIPEGHRALRGQLLRQETYGHDGPPLEDVPFYVFERTAWVRQVQPGRGGKAPVYDVRQNEAVTVNYERELGAPRIKHEITLTVDDFGVITRSAEIAYGNPRPQHPSQAANQVLVRDRVVSNRSDQSTWHRVRIPIEDKIWQLVGVTSASANQLLEGRDIRSAFDELPEVEPCLEATGSHKRLVEYTRYRYWRNDLSSLLHVGVLESRALAARIERLAFTTPAIDALMGGEPSLKTLTDDGGFVVDEGAWWAPGETTTYDAVNFYVAKTITDTLGHESSLRWDDSYLTVVAKRDPFGNVDEYINHPRLMRTWQHTDQNGNVIASRYDPVGLVVSRAVVGKPTLGEGDSVLMTSLEASAHDDPTMVTTYDLGAWKSVGRPGWIRTRHRNNHRDEKTAIQDQVVSFDGSDRDAGVASRSGGNIWLITGVVERDANGLVIREAPPFYSDATMPDAAALETALSSGVRFTRDALGRIIQTDYPDGTFSNDRITAWARVRADQTDNVLDSRWYADRQSATHGRAGDFAARQASGANNELRAAALAAAHARTPTTEMFDAAGRVVVVKTEMSSQVIVEMRTERDWRGDITALVDARGIVTRRVHRDLIGRTVAVEKADTGVERYALAADGSVLLKGDSLERFERRLYDALGRHILTYVRSGNGLERLAEMTIYGGGEVTVPDVQANNLVGAAHMKIGPHGLETIEARDINGNVTHLSAQLPIGDDEAPDWRAIEQVSHAGQVLALLVNSDSPQLEKQALTFDSTYDALSRPVRSIGMNVAAAQHAYGSHGFESSTRVRMSDGNGDVGIVRVVEEGPDGRPTGLALGDRIFVRRKYDWDGRVSEIVAGSSLDTPVQDVRIVRDPLGNVMSLSEKAELVASFTYDSRSRLVRAEGLEPAASSSAVPTRYAATYTMDASGNIIESNRKIGTSDFTHRYDYQAGSNRLRASSKPSDAVGSYSATYQHDARGELIHAPVVKNLHWDAFGHLIGVEITDGVHIAYRYASTGDLLQRKATRAGHSVEETVWMGGVERTRRYDHDTVFFEQYRLAVRTNNVLTGIFSRTTIHNSLEQAEPDAPQRYQLVDHTGSVVFELATDSSILTEETFHPYGEPAVREGGSSRELAKKTFGFAGGRADLDTNMVFIAGRWYWPLLGRWIGPGPADTLNPYVFKGANPQASRIAPASTPATHLRTLAAENLDYLLRGNAR